MSLQQSLSALKEELSKADQSLRSMAGKPILNGRDSVRKVLAAFKERGGNHAKIADAYYGLVIENFECEQSIYTAVEVTAGNRLFHHIVESDKVSSNFRHSYSEPIKALVLNNLSLISITLLNLFFLLMVDIYNSTCITTCFMLMHSSDRLFQC